LERRRRDNRAGERMNSRDRALAVLRYQPVDRLPLVHFGFLPETLERWRDEGHISAEECRLCQDGHPAEQAIAERLGFDFGWQHMFYCQASLHPHFASEVVATFPDGSTHVRNGLGVIELHAPGAGSIPAEIDHLLKDRRSWPTPNHTSPPPQRRTFPPNRNWLPPNCIWHTPHRRTYPTNCNRPAPSRKILAPTDIMSVPKRILVGPNRKTASLNREMTAPTQILAFPHRILGGRDDIMAVLSGS
jgi:hypothetical protein